MLRVVLRAPGQFELVEVERAGPVAEEQPAGSAEAGLAATETVAARVQAVGGGVGGEPPDAGQTALVRVLRVGICGSDRAAYAGRMPLVSYPRVLGHELAVEVLESPPNERGIEPGCICAVEPYLPCGRCYACRLGRTNCCENLLVLGVHVDGGMQGLLRLPLSMLHAAGDLDPDHVALVETLSVGARAVRRAAVKEGERVLVVGAGPIGLAALAFARLAGAEVDVLELNRLRWTAAIAAGADRIDTGDGPIGRQLYPVVFDATGSRVAMERSFERVEHAGRLGLLGLVPERVSFDDRLFHTRELTLLASRNSSGEFPRVIEAIALGKIQFRGWITHRLRLDGVPMQFAQVCEQPNLVKAMVEVPAWAAE